MPLRVATLNVWALPPPLGRDVKKRLHSVGREIGALQLDIAALQEVWTHEAREILIDAGRASGMPFAWYRPEFFGAGGLLLLSRWPFLESDFEEYLLHGLPHLTHLDYYGGKGFVRTRVDGPDGPFTLFNTHLQARYGSRVDHEYVGHRAGQIVQLARAVRQIEEPVLLLGDFNMREKDAGYAVLHGLTGARDLSREFGLAEATVLPENPYRSHDTPRRVDYVFARDGRAGHWEPRLVRRAFDTHFTLDGEPAAYSDHAGVVAELALAVGEGVFAAPVDRDAIHSAGEALRAGRERAERRRGSHRGAAVAAFGAAGALAAALRSPAVNRRRFLRSAFRGATLALVAPATALAVVSELAVPGEMEAFDAIRVQLALLGNETRNDQPVEEFLLPVSSEEAGG